MAIQNVRDVRSFIEGLEDWVKVRATTDKHGNPFLETGPVNEVVDGEPVSVIRMMRVYKSKKKV